MASANASSTYWFIHHGIRSRTAMTTGAIHFGHSAHVPADRLSISIAHYEYSRARSSSRTRCVRLRCRNEKIFSTNEQSLAFFSLVLPHPSTRLLPVERRERQENCTHWPTSNALTLPRTRAIVVWTRDSSRSRGAREREREKIEGKRTRV